jgi:hypothetical protein
VRDDLQELAGSITVLEDITDRKHIEAELGRLESQVQQAQRMISSSAFVTKPGNPGFSPIPRSWTR